MDLRSLWLASTLTLAGCASASPPAPPGPPPPPPRIAVRVLFTSLEVIDDKEGGSGDWTVTLWVDGHKLRVVKGEADSGGAVDLDLDAHSEGLERDHQVLITARVQEYDGGFDNTLELVGNETRVFGQTQHWGLGAHDIDMESDEGKVRLHLQILKAAPRGIDSHSEPEPAPKPGPDEAPPGNQPDR